MQITFQFRRADAPFGEDSTNVGITITAPTLTQAEQGLLILDTDSKTIAIVQTQPGFVMEEVSSADA